MALTNAVITQEHESVQLAIKSFRETTKQIFRSTISEEKSTIIDAAAERAIEKFLLYKDFSGSVNQNFQKLMSFFGNECPFIKT